LGLDGYALDFIEGPDPVLAMLCSEKRVHLTGVALRDISDEQYQRLSEGEKINSFACGSSMYRITRRKEYGPGATSTMSRTIRPGQFWKDEPLDTSAKTELEQRLREREGEFVEMKKQNEEISAKEEALNEKVTEIEEEVVSFPSQIPRSTTANASYRKDWSQTRAPYSENIINGNTSLTRSVRGIDPLMFELLLT
jgi:hypothetical protein